MGDFVRGIQFFSSLPLLRLQFHFFLLSLHWAEHMVFTSWSRGASIGWHSDNNRPYLKQRDFAAVCYLNTYGEDFKGGLFRFQDWEPTTIEPMAGITNGERLTLTLWFSRDGSHDEDARLISFLSQRQLHCSVPELHSFLPLPVSSKMYWFPPEQASTYGSGFDICFVKILAFGYDLYSPQDNIYSALDSSNGLSEALMEPLRLARGDEICEEEFVNVLHVLQVVQFYCWKASELQTSKHGKKINLVPLSQSQREEINRLKRAFLNDEQSAETLFSGMTRGHSKQHPFNWASFSAAVAAWEAYCKKLGNKMLLSLPYWRMHQSLFSVAALDIEKEIET